MLRKKLSEKELNGLKEYLFQKQKQYYKRISVSPKKKISLLRRESNKMLYVDFVVIDE